MGEREIIFGPRLFSSSQAAVRQDAAGRRIGGQGQDKCGRVTQEPPLKAVPGNNLVN